MSTTLHILHAHRAPTRKRVRRRRRPHGRGRLRFVESARPVGGLQPRGASSSTTSIDTYALKPIAEGYRTVVPSIVRAGVRNFFANLNDVWIGVNNLLQGKVDRALSDWMRFAINSTFGLAGLIDVASDTRLEKHNEDFGQTLGWWGVPPGPYFVVPFLGPSTVRDARRAPGRPDRLRVPRAAKCPAA